MTVPRRDATSVGTRTAPATDRRADALDDAAITCDAILSAAATSLRFLLTVTPVDVDRAWEEFAESDHRRTPDFRYRPAAVDPERLLRQLDGAPTAEVADPTLSALLRAARDDVAGHVALIAERSTERFLPRSVEVYGGVDDSLLSTAQAVLDVLPSGEVQRGGRTVDADAFAEDARQEIARYPALRDRGTTVTVREDVAGVLVEQGHLLVGAGVRIAVGRIAALLQHEVGTHIVTFVNGQQHALDLLRTGLPGAEETQEGLAVLSEYLVGGLDAVRMRLLAGRVVAVRTVLDGADFPDTYATLTDEHGFPPRRAFTITMRVHRGGGLTKDAMYLRGLHRVLRFVASGGEVADLTLGKVSLEHLRAVAHLRRLGVVGDPVVRPRWSELEAATPQLHAVRRGTTILQVAEEAA